jgi:hypothetical protein
VNARELLNQLVDAMSDGGFDWDKLPVVGFNTESEKYLRMTGISEGNNQLRIEFVRRDGDDDFIFELDALKWLDVVTANALKRKGLDNFDALGGIGFEDLTRIRNLGIIRIEQIEKMMDDNGHSDAGWVKEFRRRKNDGLTEIRKG